MAAGNRLIEQIKDNVVKSIESFIPDIRNVYREYDLNATYQTERSYRAVRTATGGQLRARSYSNVAFTGRRPGKVPYGFTGIIKEWIIDKGMKVKRVPYKRKQSLEWTPKYTEYERSLNIAASSIAYTIKSKGSRKHRVPSEKVVIINSIFVDIADQSRKFISTALAKQVISSELRV